MQAHLGSLLPEGTLIVPLIRPQFIPYDDLTKRVRNLTYSPLTIIIEHQITYCLLVYHHKLSLVTKNMC